MSYIKIFQNTQALSVSGGNNYSEDQLIHIFMDNVHQGGKYSAQIASHRIELNKEEKITHQKYSSISSLHTDYLNIDSSSGCAKNSEREDIVQTKFTFCGGANHSAESVSKGPERKSKKLVQMVIRTTDVQNVRLANALDLDLNIT